MKTFISLTSPNPQHYEFKKQYFQVEFPQEEGKVSFITYIMPVAEDTALFFAAWGDLFTELSAVRVAGGPEMDEVLAEIWPLTVKYLAHEPQGTFGDGALLCFPAGFFRDSPQGFWALGFEATGFGVKELVEFSSESIDQVLRLSKMCLGLFLEVTDNARVERWIVENQLIDHPIGHETRKLLSKQKLLLNFGILPTDFGPLNDSDRFVGWGLSKPLL